jgi:hypothetical protein
MEMTTRSLCFALLSLLVSVPCVAAPAPLPKPGRTGAEAVFHAQTADHARLARGYLLSDAFLWMLARDSTVADLLADLKEWQRRDWLRDRVIVVADGDRVRVRIDGESRTLALVRAATALIPVERQIVTEKDERQARVRRLQAAALRDEYAIRLAQVKRLIVKRECAASFVDLREIEAQVARYEMEANPLKLLAEPRLVRRR